MKFAQVSVTESLIAVRPSLLCKSAHLNVKVVVFAQVRSPDLRPASALTGIRLHWNCQDHMTPLKVEHTNRGKDNQSITLSFFFF